jgi:hypothetical protein
MMVVAVVPPKVSKAGLAPELALALLTPMTVVEVVVVETAPVNLVGVEVVAMAPLES